MSNIKQLPREIRRSIEKINKNMTPEMREEMARKAELADKAIAKEREYYMETQDFISAHGQFLTSIINGFASNGENFKMAIGGGTNMELYEEAYKVAADMAANYVRRLNEYKKTREDNMPNFKQEIQ